VTILKKPVSRRTETRVSHGIAALVITLYPGGLIGIREARRRKEIRLDAAQLYLAALWSDGAARRKRR